MKCPKCKKSLERSTRFCPACGARVEKNAPNISKMLLPLGVAVIGCVIGIFIATHLGEETPAIGETAQTGSILQETENKIPSEETLPLVSDAFYQDTDISWAGNYCYYHIPKVNLDVPGIAETNAYIYDGMYQYLQDYSYPSEDKSHDSSILHMSYLWGTKGPYLSILVDAMEGEPFRWAYNISMETGKRISDEELLSAYDMTLDQFYGRVRDTFRQAVYDKRSASDLSNPIFQNELDDILSDENVHNVTPYIDGATGDLCCIGYLDYSAELFNLSGSASPREPWKNEEYPSWESLMGEWYLDEPKTEALNNLSMELILGKNYENRDCKLYANDGKSMYFYMGELYGQGIDDYDKGTLTYSCYGGPTGSMTVHEEPYEGRMLYMNYNGLTICWRPVGQPENMPNPFR